jgi:hypothetical protein
MAFVIVCLFIASKFLIFSKDPVNGGALTKNVETGIILNNIKNAHVNTATIRI